MVGIVVAAHGDLAQALVSAAEGIVGRMERVTSVSFRYEDNPDDIRGRLLEAISSAEGGGGVLIFTDMFGGTPTNMALPLARRGKVEVVAGVNLPMLLKAQSLRRDMALGDLAAFVRDYGAKNILLAVEPFPAASGKVCAQR